MTHDPQGKAPPQSSEPTARGVRKVLLSGIFWRILIIEAILLVWSLGYRIHTQGPGIEELAWYALRIVILITIIIVFMMVTFRRFLNCRIITPLEAISRANRQMEEKGYEKGDVQLSGDTPREILEIVSTRSRMLDAILRVSRERLDLVNFIRDTFGRYLSKEIVDEILESPQGTRIGGRRETVTVLMSDLRGFTGFSETQDPEALVQLLNRYLERMSRVILSYDGIIDEFIGDAILAIFGVPENRGDDPERAVACALAMQNELQVLNREIVAEGYPALEMGIGIDTGPVVVGNIGSEVRLKYGIVGTTVNTASRIESYTVGGQVLVGECTYGHVRERVRAREPLSVMTKGLKKPLVSYPIEAIGAPYNVSIEPLRPDTKMVALELSFDCWEVSEKEVKARRHSGETLALNANEIEAVVSPALAALSDLKLRFDFCTDVHCFGDMYAKVLSVEIKNQQAVHRLRVTSVDPTDQAVLMRWVREGALV